MNDNIPFRLIDAFTATSYGGNPAGVVLVADGLSTEQMQAVAREVNASETAFICGGDDLHRPPRLRWFTPVAEVDLCGHATTVGRSHPDLDNASRVNIDRLRDDPIPQPIRVRRMELAVHE